MRGMSNEHNFDDFNYYNFSNFNNNEQSSHTLLSDVVYKSISIMQTRNFLKENIWDRVSLWRPG